MTGSSLANILTMYEEIEARIEQFKAVSGLSCLKDCGSCCENRNSEATILEILPMA